MNDANDEQEISVYDLSVPLAEGLKLELVTPDTVSPFDELKNLVESLQDMDVVEKLNHLTEIQALFNKMIKNQ